MTSKYVLGQQKLTQRLIINQDKFQPIFWTKYRPNIALRGVTFFRVHLLLLHILHHIMINLTRLLYFNEYIDHTLNNVQKMYTFLTLANLYRIIKNKYIGQVHIVNFTLWGDMVKHDRKRYERYTYFNLISSDQL